jgi:predicted RNase H-like HicB family nuclease
MIEEYIKAALEIAKYELIENEEPYYAEIESLKGVWATGKTLEECRRNLISTLEGWIIMCIRNNIPIPAIDGKTIDSPKEIITVLAG